MITLLICYLIRLIVVQKAGFTKGDNLKTNLNTLLKTRPHYCGRVSYLAYCQKVV